ncbi:MAG: hypothetical protein JXB04_09605 [Kiritimatiellae bacterium]|nr:hypothetical protein [Kiritimatiellia bacterium]
MYDWDGPSVPAGFTTAFAIICLVLVTPGAAPAEDSEANLLPNSSFEEPAGTEGMLPLNWDYYPGTCKAGGLYLKEARTGSQSFRMACQGSAGAAQGVTRRLPVEEGEKYTLSAHLKRDPEESLAGGVFCELVIEWVDKANREISRDRSRPVHSVSRLKWENESLKRVKAPKGAVQAVCGVHLSETAHGAKGAILVDDVELVTD